MAIEIVFAHKVEAWRAALGGPCLAEQYPEILAVISDDQPQTHVPVWARSDVARLADQLGHLLQVQWLDADPSYESSALPSVGTLDPSRAPRAAPRRRVGTDGQGGETPETRGVMPQQFEQERPSATPYSPSRDPACRKLTR